MKKNKLFLFIKQNSIVVSAICSAAVFLFLGLNFTSNNPGLVYDISQISKENNATADNNLERTEEKKPVHIKTPDPVKGIYMTSWVASTKDWRADLVKMINDTEINAVVIDVKDYTGKISFEVLDPELIELGSGEKRISDIKDFINHLHENNIYAVARIAVFQDVYLAKKRPELAVKTKDGKTSWRDRKGITWVDPCSKEVWDYTIKVAKEAERAGFDEINFDYIRFPSDGNMFNIFYSYCPPDFSKSEQLAEFFNYLNKALDPLGVPISADIFGMTTTNYDDLNIGQVLEKIEPYFDYICPMVYPSHYPATYNGFKNPAEHPYEVVKLAMDTASSRLIAASSTPLKIRPWLQDFDLGAEYTADMVRKQMQATYDAGLNSWFLWDPANKYTRSALLLRD